MGKAPKGKIQVGMYLTHDCAEYLRREAFEAGISRGELVEIALLNYQSAERARRLADRDREVIR